MPRARSSAPTAPDGSPTSALARGASIIILASALGRCRGRLHGFTRRVGACRVLDSAVAPRSGRVSLDGLLVSDACFVRVESRRPPRPSLAKQVPALVQRDLEPPEPLTLGVGHLPMRFTLEQLVLLACKLVDPAEDLVNVHNASPPSSRNHRLRPRRSRGPGRGGRRGGSVPFDS